ncbi:uncharacterized protein [Venturia canescens]|uniref:uncharacterized protein n=1 Tax=Venturia canescens TaxID=32260 RepID=UPI001C9C8470|nr:uncharacterized protein LOC122410580 [Venturia canescens]
MAHGVGEVVNEHSGSMKMAQNTQNQQTSSQHGIQQSVSQRKNVGVMGSRRIFAAAFKLKVLDSYRNDIDCRGNQRATARKYGIHRRQIQKWLQCEDNLRSSCAESNATTTVTSTGCCDVPVGSNRGVTASPGLVNGQIDATSKVDSITTSSPSTLSTPLTSSSSLMNANGTNHIANCNVIVSIGNTSSSGTTTPAPVTVGTTVAPALNLSLARLHGDELHHRQAAPPPHHPSVPPGTPLHHSIPRRATSPLQYLQHNNSHNHHQVPSSPLGPVRAMHVAYENKNQQETLQHQQPSHPRHHRRQQPGDEHQITERLVHDSSCSPEIKYSYVMTRSNYERSDVYSRSTNPDVYYQTLESYHKNISFRSNLNNNIVKEVSSIDSSFPTYRDQKVNEAGNEVSLQHAQTISFPSSASSLMVLHATTIKSERASPDALATPPGPCGTPGSPESAATMSRNHEDQHQRRPSNQLATRITVAASDTPNIDVCNNTRRNENVVAVANTATGSVAAIAGASVAVHSNETTSLAAHVHVGVDSHASELRVSEKRQREREHQYRDDVKVEYEERIRRMRVKEEVGAERDESGTKTVAGAPRPRSPTSSGMLISRMTCCEPKREIGEEETLIEDSRYHRESTRTDVITACPDYQASAGTPTGLSPTHSSGPISPITRDPAATYCVLSSPRAASSSGISTSSSCSDSEIDPLDYSSSSTKNPISDLSRRRSFSLRFKLDVLDAFHSDIGVAGNQRATARKFGINRRQVQKWLGQESELRGEIALRGGDLRQRLGPMPEVNESNSAVDLRTSSSTISSISGVKSDGELENSSSPLYCCDIGSSSQRFGYYRRGSLGESPEITSRNCTLPCCMDNFNGASTVCYQEIANQRRSSSGYPESQSSLYCYSPRDLSENGSEPIDVTTPLKRSACMLNCCYDTLPSPKRICSEAAEKIRSSPMCQDEPPQEVPLCLVKPKESFEAPMPMQMEAVTSTVPTPPAVRNVSQPTVTSSSKKDAILFKPYLDNPVSKPTEDTHLNTHNKHGGLSPLSAHSIILNNNNCQGICNLNKDRNILPQQHDYSLELSLRVPVSWAPHGYAEIPERLRSAFVRYPTSPHYT